MQVSEMAKIEQEERSYYQMVNNMRKVFLSGKSREMKFRRQQLKKLLELVTDNFDELYEALLKDMKKPLQEAMTTELGFLQRDIRHTLRNLNKWASPTTAPMHLSIPTDTYIVNHDPHGVVLIIAPWNYVHLILSPLVGAIAAGNCGILKPSEVSVNCEAVIADLVPKYLDNDCYKVVVGGPNEITSLLKEKFDYIFYTGSFNVGQIIHAAANKYLTPITLELGGKSPAYVDDSVNFRMTAQRILWGKFTNLGQTCVAPDYILCDKATQVRLIEEFKKVLLEFYGEKMQESKDLARIINNRHWNRLKTLLKRTKGTIVIGGDLDEYDLWISPTVVANVEPTDSLMEGELFGPILPIVNVNSVEQAIAFINERDTPLALYVYTSKRKVVKAFKNLTQSGALDINDCIYHCSVFEIPFGGKGESGMGRYHGKWSFDTFSYDRAVLQRMFDPFGNIHSMLPRYPPYTSFKYNFLKHGLRHFDLFYVDLFKGVPFVIVFVLGVIVAVLIMHFKLYEIITG